MNETVFIESISHEERNSNRRNPRSFIRNAPAAINKAVALVAALFICLSFAVISAPKANAGLFDGFIDTLFCPYEGVTDGVAGYVDVVGDENKRNIDAPAVSDLPAEWKEFPTMSARQYANGGSGNVTYFAKYREGTNLQKVFTDTKTGDEYSVSTRNGDNAIISDTKVEKDNDLAVYNGCTTIFSGENISSLTAHSFLNMSASIIGLSGWLLDFAISPDTLYNPMMSGINEAITGDGGLRDSLYTPFLAVVAVAIGIWFIWSIARKGEFSKGASGGIWVISAILIGAFFMTQPVIIPNFIQTVVSAFAGEAFKVVSTDAGTSSSSSSSSTSTPTEDELDGDFTDTKEQFAAPLNESYSTACAVDTGDDLANAAESIKCSLWFTFVFEGWSMVQFGSPSSEVDAAYAESEGVQAGVSEDDIAMKFGEDGPTVESFSLYAFMSSYPMVGLDGSGPDNNHSSAAASAKLAEITDSLNNASANSEASNYANNWMGGNSGTRVLSAALVFILAILGASFMIVSAVTILINMMLVLFLTLIMPIVFLFGIHPAGRSIVYQWVGFLVATLVRAIGNITVLIVAVTFFRIILLSTMSWGIKVTAAIIITTVLFAFRDDIIRMFTDTFKVDTPGRDNAIMGKVGNSMNNVETSGTNSTQKHVKGFSDGLVGATVGAGVGALVGAKGAAKIIGDKNVDTRSTMKGVASSIGKGVVKGGADGFKSEKDGGSSTSISSLQRTAKGISAGVTGAEEEIKGKAVANNKLERRVDDIMAARKYKKEFERAQKENDEEWFQETSRDVFGGGEVLDPRYYNVVGYGQKDENGQQKQLSQEADGGIRKRSRRELQSSVDDIQEHLGETTAKEYTQAKAQIKEAETYIRDNKKVSGPVAERRLAAMQNQLAEAKETANRIDEEGILAKAASERKNRSNSNVDTHERHVNNIRNGRAIMRKHAKGDDVTPAIQEYLGSQEASEYSSSKSAYLDAKKKVEANKDAQPGTTEYITLKRAEKTAAEKYKSMTNIEAKLGNEFSNDEGNEYIQEARQRRKEEKKAAEPSPKRVEQEKNKAEKQIKRDPLKRAQAERGELPTPSVKPTETQNADNNPPKKHNSVVRPPRGNGN